jgi:polysaccharide pyruvyl transferase WcaK-like protein
VPTVFLDGAFGQCNPGGEALLDAFLAALPDWETVAASSHPRATMAGRACRAVQAADPVAITRALRDADAIVLTGGSLFGVLSPATGQAPTARLRRALALGTAARATGKPLAMLGVSAGRMPNRWTRALARSIIQQADLLILRDEESALALTAIGAPAPFRVGADPVWTLAGADNLVPATGSRDGVVIALHHAATENSVFDRLIEALRPLASSGIRLRVQPWQLYDCEPNDLDLAQSLAARLGHRTEVMDPPADLEDARRELSATRLLVSLRFHAIVAAATVGTPFVALAHEPKLTALARRLRQPVVQVTADPTTIYETIVTGLVGQPARPAGVRAEIACAEEGFRLLRLLLSGGAASELDTFDGLRLEPVPWVAS